MELFRWHIAIGLLLRVDIWNHDLDLTCLVLGYQHAFCHDLPYLSLSKVELEEVSYSSIQSPTSGHRQIDYPDHTKTVSCNGKLFIRLILQSVSFLMTPRSLIIYFRSDVHNSACWSIAIFPRPVTDHFNTLVSRDAP
jgi:hypothetical protein